MTVLKSKQFEKQLQALLQKKLKSSEDVSDETELLVKYLQQGQELAIAELGVVRAHDEHGDAFQISAFPELQDKAMATASAAVSANQNIPNLVTVLQRLELQENGYTPELAALAIR